MTIISARYRGLIYAGDTPLACSIPITQTGPMQLTVGAGTFVTTGEARIGRYLPAVHDPELAAGRLELLPDGQRVRQWTVAPTTVVLGVDAVITVTADAMRVKEYLVELCVRGGDVDVVGRSRFLPEGVRRPLPPGWVAVHLLVYPFLVPPGTTALDQLAIPVLSILPGFPPGTTAEDWTTQGGP